MLHVYIGIKLALKDRKIGFQMFYNFYFCLGIERHSIKLFTKRQQLTTTGTM